MGLAVYFATPVLCTILFRHFVRQPIGSIFLEGLYAYLPHEASITPPPGAKSTKRDRKLLQKRQVALKGASQSVVAQQLSPSALSHLNSEPSTFGAALETLGVLLLVLLVGLAVHLIMGPLFGMWQDVLMWSLGPLVVLWAAVQLLLLEGGGSLGKLFGARWYVSALGALSASAAYVALVLAAPAGWLPWDIHSAARDMDQLFNVAVARLLASRLREFKPPPPLTTDPHVLAAVLAVVAGILAASLLGSCARVARLHSFISPVPHWADRYLQPGLLGAAAVRLSLALPLLVVAYGISPVVEWWGALLPPAVLASAGPALVAAVAAAQLAAVRPLVGAHLGGALLEWHLLRHEGTNTPAKPALIRKRLTFVYATVCHTALQLIAPAAIMLCLTLMYCGASGRLDPYRSAAPLLYNMGARRSVAGPPGGAPPLLLPQTPLLSASDLDSPLEGLDMPGSDLPSLAAAAEAAAAAMAAAAAAAASAAPPLGFLVFLSSFLAWWVCAVTCLFTYPMMFVYRAGLNVG